MEAWREELYHHGILGQKWGKQNGPPYPLGKGDHSAAERRAAGGMLNKMIERRAAKKRKKKQQEQVKKMQAAKKAKAEEKKRQEEEEAKNAAERDRVIKSGTAEEVLARKDLTPQELQYARMRLSEQQQIMANMPKPVIQKGKTKAEAALEKIDNVVNLAASAGKTISKASDAVTDTVKGINTGIAVYNAITGSNIKKITLDTKKPSWDELRKQEQYLQEKNKTEKSNMELEKDRYNHEQWKLHKDDKKKKKG